MAAPRGYPVVLTADRTLTAGYPLLFDGMLAASQTTTTPRALMSWLLLPRAKSPNGRAAVAPLGLRRIEAALVRAGFSPDEVAVVNERQLDAAIGPDTRVVGISSGEPAGGGMNSTTMTAITGGKIYPEAYFRRLAAKVRRAVQAQAPHAKVVLGGPGAWQVAALSETRRQAGVSHLVTGYAEGNVGEFFHCLHDGDAAPEVLEGQGVPGLEIPAIRGASTMGVVEISRGCGLGCHFCTLARVPMVHLPEETVEADVRTNVAAGQTSVALLSEDFFRYGAQGVRARPQALLSLLTRLRRIAGLRLVQIDHANLCSLAQYSDEELSAARKLLGGERGVEFLWVNVGVETAAGELLKANGGAAKMGGVAPGEWGEFSAAQVQRLIRAGFFPLVSLILGLPGERPEDVRRTRDWVQGFHDARVSVFPVLHAPIDGAPPPAPRSLGRAHWALLRAAYRLNFKWIPRLYWDNQAGAGVPVWKRTLIQLLGRGQVAQWSGLLAYHAWRAKG